MDSHTIAEKAELGGQHSQDLNARSGPTTTPATWLPPFLALLYFSLLIPHCFWFSPVVSDPPPPFSSWRLAGCDTQMLITHAAVDWISTRSNSYVKFPYPQYLPPRLRPEQGMTCRSLSIPQSFLNTVQCWAAHRF